MESESVALKGKQLRIYHFLLLKLETFFNLLKELEAKLSALQKKKDDGQKLLQRTRESAQPKIKEALEKIDSSIRSFEDAIAKERKRIEEEKKRKEEEERKRKEEEERKRKEEEERKRREEEERRIREEEERKKREEVISFISSANSAG